MGDGRPFFNEPLRDFSNARAVETVQAIAIANDTTVERACRWSGVHGGVRCVAQTDPVERAHCLTRAAAMFRRQRDDLSAIVIHESGKPWREADADVCEAIDFCEYYARQAVGLFRPRRLGRFVGELNRSLA